MGAKVVICHWNEGGSWNAIEVSQSALAGHENHEMDIYPSIEGVTSGSNWPRGEEVYLNGCQIAATPEPSPSPPLPESGSWVEGLFVVAALLIIAGLIMLFTKSQEEIDRELEEYVAQKLKETEKEEDA